MCCERDNWTLVRYAGPASKALIGSKPIGSELECDLGIYPQHVNKELTRLVACEVRSNPAIREKVCYPNRLTGVAQ